MDVKRIYNERWTEQEEANLINARIRLDHEFKLPKTKYHFKICWKKVVREAKLDKSMQLVTNKWQNILKKYKKIIRNHPTIDEDIYDTEWSSFKDLHIFLKNKTRIKPGFICKSRTSADDSTTDASISVGDLDNMNVAFDYEKFETKLVNQPIYKPQINTTNESYLGTEQINKQYANPDLTIVKSEIDIEPIPNDRNDNVNSVRNNFETHSSNKVINVTENYSNRQTGQTSHDSNDCTDFDDDKPNYLVHPLNRVICGKRKIIRKPEYVSSKVIIKEPNDSDQFRLPRIPEEDEDRSFLLSLVPSLRKLNGEQKLIVKTEFLKILTKITYPRSTVFQNI